MIDAIWCKCPTFRDIGKTLKTRYSDIISFFVVCIATTSFAQQQQPLFENISTTHGQLHTRIDHGIEDGLGFIWFGTTEGLFRYDGYELKGYRHNVNDSTSVSSPSILHIAQDKKGRIWAATTYGVNLLDGRTGTFKKFLPTSNPLTTKGRDQVTWMLNDQNDRLLVVSRQSLHILDKETGKFQKIDERGGASKRHPVRTIFETRAGTVWCGAENGLLKLEARDTNYTYVLPAKGAAGHHQSIETIAEAGDRKLWLGTRDGLALYDPDSDAITTGYLPGDFDDQRITALVKTRSGDLWIGFEDNGLGVLYADQSFKHYVHDEDVFNSLNNNSVQFILEDQFQNIWVGTLAGITKISPKTSGFSLIQNRPGIDKYANHVYVVQLDRQGNLWMKTGIGLTVRQSDNTLLLPLTNAPMGDDPALGDWIYEDPEGAIWITMDDHGIWKKPKQSSQFVKMRTERPFEQTHVHKIMEDSEDQNTVWIGSVRGLFEFHTATNQGTWHRPREQYSELSSNRMVIFEQFGETIWLYYTYHNTLGWFDKKTKKFHLVRAPLEERYVLEGVIRDIAISADSSVWLATSYGLTQFHIPDSSFQIFTQDDGMPENSLNAVLIDNNGEIWVSGNQFIARFDRSTGSFPYHRTVKEIKFFISKSRHVAQDGTLYFGGLNGVLTFHPDSIKPDPISPKVVLTNFRLKDTTFLLDTAFEYVTDIRLTHRQNDLAFDFSGLHFIEPGGIRYKCRLVGYDEGWRDLGHAHSVNYTNLNPGEYVFHATAANRDGVWNPEELVINLDIAPPFTQTGWFRGLVALVLLLLAYIMLRIWFYQQRLRRQKQVAEAAAEYRMRFLSNVSHEIRTPMNAIIGLSGLVSETPLDAQQRKYLSAINRSSKDLLQMINALLDQSKLDSGMFSFQKAPFRIREVTDQLQTLLEPLADEKGLELNIVIDAEVSDTLHGDALRLSQILTNLIANAIKFTESGQVTLSITQNASEERQATIAFSVSDTGIGIPQEKLDTIFERFVDDNARIEATGTGLGLYIARQLVERQGGTIGIASLLGSGTTITVKMPFEIAATDLRAKQKSKGLTMPHLKVLLVDDAEFNLMVITEMLKKRVRSPEITSATSALEALSILTSQSFDVIIMDAKMPGMDGLEATRRIRAMNEPVRSTTILGATAGAMQEQLEACLNSGMDDVITKPIDIDRLMQKLIELTGIPAYD